MKKSIFVCAACLTMVSIYVQAQNKETAPANPTAPIGHLVTPPAPPEPPPPPPPPPPSIEEKTLLDIEAIPPVPPTPPVSPQPPVPPGPSVESYKFPVVVNSIGFDISVHLIKGEEVVFVKRNGTMKKIKMSTWIANRKFFVKKYGMLPPPPPGFETRS